MTHWKIGTGTNIGAGIDKGQLHTTIDAAEHKQSTHPTHEIP